MGDYNQSTCVLYTIENALNWDANIPEPEKYGCHHLSSWMTCAHNGKSLQEPKPTMPKNLLKNSQAKSEDKSVTAAADAVDRKNPSNRAGWECKHNMYCLKADGLELIKYDEPSGQSWNIATCQKKCEDYGEGCIMVDIHSYTGDFDYNQSTCVLYTIENALNWDANIPEPEKYGCHHLSSWMTCAHNGKSLQAPKPTMSKNLLKDSQAKSEDKSVTAAADAVDRKNPSYRAGWECKLNMYCLKADGLELIKYDEPSGQSWNIATCQKKCEEYGEGCVMVDIHTWSGNYYRSYNKNQKSCILYTAENARSWDKWVP